MLKHLILIACLVFTGLVFADDAAEAPSVDLKSLSATEFLRVVREPLRREVWGEITGRLTYKNKQDSSKDARGDLRLRVTFTEESMFSQIVLNEVNVYGLVQRHDKNAKATIEIDMPPEEVKPGLFDFGLAPEDISFAFLYWDFVEELPGRSSRWRDCRVMKLASPKGDGFAHVLFDEKLGFPMEVYWYKTDEQKPWRTMILKGAKRYENGLWFVKEMQLEGRDSTWKTAVKFDFASINAVGE